MRLHVDTAGVMGTISHYEALQPPTDLLVFREVLTTPSLYLHDSVTHVEHVSTGAPAAFPFPVSLLCFLSLQVRDA